MSISISIYIHGVPNGQNIWNVKEREDINYIDTLYKSSGSNVQMIVETKQCNQKKFCYYTYMRANNVLDQPTGRAGAYFAITVKLNHYYADLSNMYNVLNVAFIKYILNSVLKQEGDYLRYQIGKFEQEDRLLENVSKEIESYLEKFSVDSDFVSLDSATIKSNRNIINSFLLECNQKKYAEWVIEGNTLSVSTLHLSEQMKDVLKQKERSIRDITEEKQKCLSEQTLRSKQELETVKSNYNSQLGEKEERIKELEAEQRRLEEKFHQTQIETEKAKNILTAVNKIISDAHSLGFINPIMTKSPLTIDSNKKNSSVKKRIKRFLIKNVWVIITVLLILIGGFFAYNNNVIPISNAKNRKVNLVEKKENKTSLDKKNVINDSLKSDKDTELNEG